MTTELLGAQMMSNRAYHAAPGMSASKLKTFARSPRHYLQSVLGGEREQTPAMLLGSVTHTLILEPHLFDAEYAIAPSVDKRTKLGKEIYADWEQKVVPSATIITADIKAQAQRMADAVLEDKWAAATLLTGRTEESLFWQDKTGKLCKCRPDRWRDDLRIVIDVKTTVDASPDAFQRTAWSSLYHLQAAFYMEGIYQATGVRPRAFILLAVEKEPPYISVPYLIDDDLLRRGEQQARELLDRYATCERDDCWPGYTDDEDGLLTLTAPRWA